MMIRFNVAQFITRIVAIYNNIAPNGVQYISVDVFRTKPINNNTVIAGINIRPTAKPGGGGLLSAVGSLKQTSV